MPSIVIVAILLQLFGSVSGKCSHLEVETCTKTMRNCHCVPCHTCTKGQGLQPQCGSRSILLIPHCIPCEDGVTYSSKKSVGSCEPCPECHGRNVVQPCNTTHPTVCSENCAEGYKFNEIVEDCQLIPTTGPTVKTKKGGNSSLRTAKPKGVPTLLARNKYGVRYGETFKPILFSALGLSILCIIVVLIRKGFLSCCRNMCTHMVEDVCIPIAQCWRRSRVRARHVTGANIGLLSQTTIDEQILLNDISPDLRRTIGSKLSKRTFRGIKDWEDVAFKYGISKNDMEQIKGYVGSDTTSPGEVLLEKILTLKPEERLKDFVAVLRDVGRRDVIRLIMERPRSFTNRFAEIM